MQPKTHHNETRAKKNGNPFDRHDESGDEDFKAAKLEFLRMMLRELRQMATQTNEPTLLYLIEMAALEAAEACKVHKYKTELHAEH